MLDSICDDVGLICYFDVWWFVYVLGMYCKYLNVVIGMFGWFIVKVMY